MGIFSGLLGNASEVDVTTVRAQFAPVLIDGEVIEKAYQLIRDMFVFTNRRLIFVNRQGLTGNKVDYASIPYKNITRFSIETAGALDLDAELKIWVTGGQAPYQLQFNKKLSIYEVQKVLAGYVLR